MANKVPPPVRTTPPHFSNGAEPITGVFHPRTGRTRQFAKWGAVIAALTALFSPIVNAVAARIYPPEREQELERQVRELREQIDRPK